MKRKAEALSEKVEEKGAMCEECKEKPSKYKCPGCSIRTCSLPCVNAHKNRTNCSGKRNVTQLVTLSEYDDNILLSDYNFLEDTKRAAESAQRFRVNLCGHSCSRLPSELQSLRNAAVSRGTELRFLPRGMTMRERNQTQYNQEKDLISWTIEWRFYATDVILFDHGVSEDANLHSVIENHLKPGPWKHPLKPFCDEQLERLRFLVRKCPKRFESRMQMVDIQGPIRQQLSNLAILEYPVIFVVLPSHNFEVAKDAQPVLRDFLGGNHDSPRGVSFRDDKMDDNSFHSGSKNGEPGSYDEMAVDPDDFRR